MINAGRQNWQIKVSLLILHEIQGESNNNDNNDDSDNDNDNDNNNHNNNICICVVPFPRDTKRCCLYYYPIRKLSQPPRLT